MAFEQEILSSIQNTNRILSDLVLRTGTTSSFASYEFVSASSTAQVLGDRGQIGDYLARLLVIPATTTPGSVTILDGAVSQIVYTGGTIGNLVPSLIQLGIKSVNGGWSLTTGANVSVIAMGTFR